MNRSLEEVKLRASILLDHRISQELRDQCIGIARMKSPSAAFYAATLAAVMAGLHQIEALGVAKATRWLATIRRDHGQEEFDSMVKTLTNNTPAV